MNYPAPRRNLRAILGIFIILLLLPLTLYALSQPRGTYDIEERAAQELEVLASAFAFVPDQIIAKPKEGVSEAKLERLFKHKSVEVKKDLGNKVKLLKTQPHKLDKTLQELSQTEYFEYVERDYLAEPVLLPNDPEYGKQWGLKKISAETGWEVSSGSSLVVIAVVDSGIDADHPDLAGKIIPGHNFLDGTSNTDDDYGHGTHVAGIATALTNNTLGIAGTSWESRLLPLKVFDSQTGAWYSRVANGIIYAADNGARVINVSLGNYPTSSFLEAAVNYAASRGVAVVGAAGNNNLTAVIYPAAFEKAIAVGATDPNDLRASFSNYGGDLDVAAPGVSIYSTYYGGGFAYMSGTSMAAPHVAGLMALIFSANQSLDLAQARAILEKNTDDLGETGFDLQYGWGRVNISKAVRAASSEPPAADTVSPTVSILSPTATTSLSGVVEIQVEASDNVGVTQVEFYVNNVLYGRSLASPFIYFWDTSLQNNGFYELSAKAYDLAGNLGISGPVQVTVDNLHDTEAPLVAIVNPKGGATLSSTVLIEASATDNVAVKRVEFLIDGSFLGEGTVDPFTFSLDTRNFSNGLHILKARAFDSSENVGESPEVTVVIDQTTDTTPPKVAVTVPQDGVSLSGNKVKIVISASDEDKIVRVEIYLDGVRTKAFRSPPYEWDWVTKKYAKGYHTIEARAYDSSGNVGIASVTVYLF